MEIQEIKEAIKEQFEEVKQLTLLSTKKVLTMADMALLTGYSRSHLYKLTCERAIPFYKPNGKEIYFERGEVEAWLLKNRVAPVSEAETAAAAYIVKKGGVK